MGASQALFPGLGVSATQDGATVFDDEGSVELGIAPESPHFLRRFAGARNHGDSNLLQPGQRRLRRTPVVVVIKKGAVEVSHDPEIGGFMCWVGQHG
ncbi:hypothetical protein RS9916_28594 [Synechococcus sp. RS9916]|nr:hypothetical protein RS9916_28594 [Synechococcus sp. RS9916]